MKSRSLVIAGYYGFGNAGDELILYSLIRTFREENPLVEITVLSNKPSETAQCFGVKSVNRWKPLSWASVLFHSDRFVLGGGGLLQESTGPWNHVYYLSLLLIANWFRCQTDVIALGVDPIHGRLNRLWTKAILTHCVETLSVRDEASRAALIDAGVSFPIEIVPDPVFELKHVPANDSSREGIALALSFWPDRPEWDREIARLCDRLRDRMDVPIDLLVFFSDQDAAFADDVARRSMAIRRVRFWKFPLDVTSWIPQYRVVVSTRFHALVLAASSGTEFIGWGKQRKVRSLCEKFQKSYWDFTEEPTQEQQIDRIVRLYQSMDKSVILATRMD